MVVDRIGDHARECERRLAISAPAQRPAIRACDVTANALLVTLRGVQQAERKPEPLEQQLARDRQLRQPMEQRRLEVGPGWTERRVADHEPAQPRDPIRHRQQADRSTPSPAHAQHERSRHRARRAPRRATPRDRSSESAPHRAACSIARVRSDRGTTSRSASPPGRARSSAITLRHRNPHVGLPWTSTMGCPSAGPHSRTCICSPPVVTLRSRADSGWELSVIQSGSFTRRSVRLSTNRRRRRRAAAAALLAIDVAARRATAIASRCRRRACTRPCGALHRCR